MKHSVKILIVSTTFLLTCSISNGQINKRNPDKKSNILEHFLALADEYDLIEKNSSQLAAGFPIECHPELVSGSK